MSPPINLLRGWPSTALLPVDLIRNAAQAALSEPAVAHDGLLYGPDQGYRPALEAVARWLTSFYEPSAPILPERICMTGGASQNLGCMLNVYTDPEYTRNIWVVTPAYYLAFGIFEDAGFAGKMRAVPEDGEGLDITFLEREMKKSEEKAMASGNGQPQYKPERSRAKVYKYVVYCVPTFANPSSRTMTLERRRALVRLARKYDALLVADDVYDLLQWRADPVENDKEQTQPRKAHLPRLVDVDRDLDGGAERAGAEGFGNACSNGSFSKIAGPGIRCGWVEGTKKFAYGASQTGTTRSGGAPSQLTSTYVTHMVNSGQLQHHIQTCLQPAYAARYAILMAAIDTHLRPLGFTLAQPSRDIVGGYFVWLSLPTGLTADELSEACMKQAEVIIATGRMFEVPGDDKAVKFPTSIRLCFAWETEANLTSGVERIAKVAKKLLSEERRRTRDYVIVEKKQINAIDAYR